MAHRSTMTLALAFAAPAAFAAPVSTLPDGLALNQIQVVGTHNSYKQTIDPLLLAAIGAASPAAALSLDYAHPALAAQLDGRMRAFEIDVFRDPAGGAFLNPAGYAILQGQGVPAAALLPHDVAGLDAPGFKVLHVEDIDFRSSCNAFAACLGQMKAWSDANPGHAPIFVMVEPKDVSGVVPGGVSVPDHDAESLAALDAEIAAVMGADRLVTPDMVRGGFATLEAAVLAGAWPSLEASRGRFVFLMSEENADYLAAAPNLEGRASFLRGQPGDDHAAFVLMDNPLRDGAEIGALVEAGYLVRTRADADTVEARSGDFSRAVAALASGAQIVSTDYFALPNPFGNDYFVSLPDGAAVRCNPVNGGCATLAPVPLPAPVLLLGAALLGIGVVAGRRAA